MRRKNITFAILMICSIAIMLVSGAMFVYSATSQSVTSSLSVTFNGQNVNFEAQGWYHVHGGSRTAMVNNDDTNTGVSFSATDAPNTVRTLKISNTEAENKAVLTSEHPYVLFTYQFTNTASEGAFGIEVSLNITPTPTNLKTIKYASSTSLYTEADLDTFKDSVTGTSTFSNEFIVANNGTKYFYILFEVDDLTLPVTFNPTFSWSVVCSDDVTPPSPFVVSGSTITALTELGQSATSLTIPNTATTLAAGAFDNINPNLTSLTIPTSVTSIDATALRHVQYTALNFSGWTNAQKAARLDEIKVAAGMYPQTVYYSGGSYTPAGLSTTGKTYTTDANGTAKTLTEYTSTDGYKYARLDSAVYQSGTPTLNGSGLAGPTGTVLYFRVEPIVVTIKTVDSSTGECIVLSDMLLGSRQYDDSITNWYSSPEIRTFLNGTFRTDAGLTSLTQHTVHNNITLNYSNAETSYSGYSTYDTQDYIWLPSYYEMKDSGGFGYTSNSERICGLTDLATATYANADRSGDVNRCYYYLRSAGDRDGNKRSVCYVDEGGYDRIDTFPDNSYHGFRLAFAFNL